MMQPSLRIDLSPPEGRTVDILAAGDFTLPSGREAANPHEVFHPDLLALLRAKDLSIVDLEFPLVTSNRPIIKSGPHVSGSPSTVQALAAAGVDVVTMANNHALDYGPEAMFATRELCERGGIRTVGVGRDQSEASQPVVMDVSGIRVAIVALAEQEFSCADEARAGAAKLDPPAAARAIREAGRQAQTVLVCVHGGNEYYPIPSPRMRTWYRFLVDCGAHAVLGDHPHTVQGTEVYAGAPIVYSLGNLLLVNPFGARRPKCWDRGMIVRLKVGGGGVHAIEFFPTQQTQETGEVRIGPLPADAERVFTSRLRRLNVIAADETLVGEFWRCFCQDRGTSYFGELKAGSAVTQASVMNLLKAGVKAAAPHYLALGLTQWLSRFTTRRRLREAELARMCNLVRCPAHHEVLVTALEMAQDGVRPRPEAWKEYTELMEECR